jgi:predicted ABC-class ATPase
MSGFGRNAGSGGGRGGSGRGAYYKEKYGRGGRGHVRENNEECNNTNKTSNSYAYSNPNANINQNAMTAPTLTSDDLIHHLQRLDRQQYPAYHKIESFSGYIYNIDSNRKFILSIGRTQSDPFAPPTRVRVTIDTNTTQFPTQSYNNDDRRRALSDYLLRSFYNNCKNIGADEAKGGQGWSGAKGGDIQIAPPTQNVLKQSACNISKDGSLIIHFTIALPAAGRSILGNAAATIFGSILPNLIIQSLLYSSLNSKHLQNHIFCIEDQTNLRNQLIENNLIAFIGNNSILPRESGALDTPLIIDSTKNNLPLILFETPESTSITLYLKNAGTKIKGCGIKKGVTVIVGGGFHGKSTLLNAIQYGIYDKIPGDGREFIVTDPSAVKIKAEDGRVMHSVGISPFINNLPFARSTDEFSTDDASGSTSQAANIIEALEIGTKTLIFDEDTCATNFMMRDNKMAALVSNFSEPITPFISRVTELYQSLDVSSILVIGGAGDYLNVADCVLKMDSYKCVDVTNEAKEIINDVRFTSQLPPCATENVKKWYNSRKVHTEILKSDGKCGVRDITKINYGSIDIQLTGLDQLVSKEQTNSILAVLNNITKYSHLPNLESIINKVENDFIEYDSLTQALNTNEFDGTLALPRRYEIAATINRLRIPKLLIKSI